MAGDERRRGRKVPERGAVFRRRPEKVGPLRGSEGPAAGGDIEAIKRL